MRSEAEPVSYCDPQTQRWTSGTFDFAVKSEHPAARSPGVQPQATAGQPGSLGGLRRGQTIHQLQSDVRPDEQAELRRQESGAPPQSMPALYQAPPPPPTAAFAAAAQHGSASTPALDPWDGMHRTSGHMPTTSATDAAQKWLNAECLRGLRFESERAGLGALRECLLWFLADYLPCAVARRAAWRFGRAQRGGSRSLTGSACAGVHRQRSVAAQRSLAQKRRVAWLGLAWLDRCGVLSNKYTFRNKNRMHDPRIPKKVL